MKKCLLTMLLAIVGCVTVMAGDDIKLSEGSVAPLKEGGVASLVIDMADTQFDNKTPLRKDGRFANVDEQLPECTKEFIREFNENTKKFTMTANADEAQYEIIVIITNLDTFVNVMSFKGGVGIKLWGTITIKNKATGENVAVFSINEEGNSGFTYQIALEEGFEGIAKYLAKRIKKGK
ncbi:hypothetical protein [Bacteroides acidifaciens]|uniref:hypothetical protein n=1 Tax=Bacteroides acidifaciens TaxID=85831 RepID=UPI0025583089|nr:hypothetical protein [Bacteroides acidifaciens]